MKTEKEFIEIIKEKNILFIATKNSDYIRISQEKKLLEKYAASYRMIAYPDSGYLKRICKVYVALFKEKAKKYDMILVGFMGQMILPFWSWKFRKKPVVLDFFISIFDTLVDDRKKLKQGSIAAKLVKMIDRMTIKKAEYIIADTNAHADYFSKEFGIDRNRFYTVYLEANTGIYYPQKIERPEEWKDQYLVVYFGSILPVQGVEVILKTIYKLRNEKKIHFIMIGPIQKKYKRPETENVTYFDWLSQQELAHYVNMSDLCLAGHFSAKIGKANRTIPGKTYIYQALQKPIILGDSDANRELFQEGNDIFYVKRGDAEALKNKILEIYKERK
ncbi:MAG: glycosyltransferase [Lachnospiraceae bacterium]|nr:glycosyltransferase [Lachnospiraceae bacterium]